MLSGPPDELARSTSRSAASSGFASSVTARRDLLRLHEPGQPIAAEHEHVVTPHALMREIDLHVRLRAERLQNDVAAVAHLGFFDRDLAGLDELLHQRLILRDLDRDAVAHQVRSTVADLSEVERVAEQPGDRRGRAHAAKLGVIARVMVDRRVRDFSRRLERADERDGLRRRPVAPSTAHLLEHDFDRHLAGDLAGGRPAHAVGDHEQRAATRSRAPSACGRTWSGSPRARSATTNASSLCSRVRPTSECAKT